MRTKSPRENIPNLDNLYEVTRDFIKEHQGEKGFINTNSETDGVYLDTIYGIRYNDVSDIGEEVIVYGVRVNDENDIEVITNPWMRTYNNVPTDEEYADNDRWESLRWSDRIFYVHTLFSIAESIEQYIEEE